MALKERGEQPDLVLEETFKAFGDVRAVDLELAGVRVRSMVVCGRRQTSEVVQVQYEAR